MSVRTRSALTTIKQLINFCDRIYEHSRINHFWNVKNYVEVLDKLPSLDCKFYSIESCDFSTLYTTLPNKLIKKTSFPI